MLQAGHIPAWKKLGLKLKHAKESTETASHASAAVNGFGIQNHIQPTASSVSANTEDGERLAKRRRIAANSSPKDATDTVLLNGHSELDGVGHTNSPITPSNASKLKKRVSFSADTKKPDRSTSATSSTVNIAKNINIMDQLQEAQGEHPVSISPRPKRTKQGKLAKIPISDLASSKANHILSYLDDFYSKSPNWKFNKNRETWILKHALSTNDIPSSHNLQLAGYIHGLKSQGARARLAVSCREALSTSEEDEEQRQSEVDQTWRDQLQREFSDIDQNDTKASSARNADYLEWILKQPRAKLLLWSLDPSTINKPFSASSKTVPKMNAKTTISNGGTTAQAEGKPKKRKNRTAVIEYSSSSESGSDESSSSSEDDEDDVRFTGSKRHDKEDGSSSSSGNDETSSDSSSESDE